MYGNYCGPYWSDGAFQTSVVGTMKPVDEFDETCMVHDAHYARAGDLKLADYEFARANIGRGVLRTAAGLVVGSQGFLRRGSRSGAPNIKRNTPNTLNILESNMQSNSSKNNSLRGKQGKKQSNPRQTSSKSEVQVATHAVPATIGTTIRMVRPIVVRNGNTARITGRDFLGTVSVAATTTFGVSTTALLSPAYFASAFLGNLCRSYESYRWDKLRIHYVPACSTSTTGSVVLASSHAVTQPALSGESSNFLPRALTQGNASMGPLWEHGYIDIDCTSRQWRLVDPTSSVDLDDNIHEELQVYYSASSSLVAGYLLAEYTCSFNEPVYQPHSTAIPIPTGPGTVCTFTDNIGVNAAGDDWNLSCLSGLTLATVNPGTIYRAVFDLVGSTAPTGTTFNNYLNAAVFSHATTSTFGVQTTYAPLVGGFTCYLVCDSSSVKAFASIESARGGIGSGQLMTRTATTAAGTYRFIVSMVGQDPATATSVQ